MNIYIHTWRGTVNIYVYVRMYISYGRKFAEYFMISHSNKHFVFGL